MSVHSWPVQGTGNMESLHLNEDKNERNTVTQSEVGVSTSRSSKGYSLRGLNQRTYLDGERSERANALYASKVGYISSLTRIRREIEEHLKSNGKLEQVESRLAAYEKSWRDFVSTHEKHLDNIDGEKEREAALSVYSEQFKRKYEFDWVISSEREKSAYRKNADVDSRCSTSIRTRSSRVSRISTLSKKKEKLAIAQLRVGQMVRKHEITKRMLQLQNESELLEAQLQREEAQISVSICEQVIEEEKEQELLDSERDMFKNVIQYGSQDAQGCFLPKEEEAPGTNHNMGYKINQGNEKEAEVVGSCNLQRPVKEKLDPKAPVYNPNDLAQELQHVGHEDGNPTPQFLSGTRPDRLKASCSSPRVTTEYPLINDAGSPLWNTESNKQVVDSTDTNDALVMALNKIVATPKIEYMHFDGDPTKYPSFIHNFETCLEKNNNSDESKLQLLIQHCRGKAKEAIESCVNLPAKEGYQVAKDTLRESFGKPHIIARAHIKRLVELPNIKKADGSSLLEFARHLDSTDRTLKGMGTQYVNDLDHVNTLKELNRKLPVFLRARWAEAPGRIYEDGSRPRFIDFLKFIKKRAALMNNEFGDDLGAVFKEKYNKDQEKTARFRKENLSFAMGIKSKDFEKTGGNAELRRCQLCAGSHGIWHCEKFKQLSVPERKKRAADKSLCFKCLGTGHYARTCPKKHFLCRSPGCRREHHTLLHNEEKNTPETSEEQRQQPSNKGVADDKVIAATGAGESRVCLGVIPVTVRPKNGIKSIETYALLDSGSEVTICSEKLASSLDIRGKELSFTLTGMTGSQSMKSQLIDIVVESIDGSTVVELSNVRTVADIPISNECIPRKRDLEKWPHLQDIDLQEADENKVTLIIGLKENPQLFLPLEYKVGGNGEPIGVRYSLGWTVMGSVGDARESPDYSVNYIQSSNSLSGLEQVEMLLNVDSKSRDIELEEITRSPRSFSCAVQVNNGVMEFDRPLEKQECALEAESKDFQDRTLKQQIEGLWKTDFGDTLVNNRPSHSVEDKRALKMMEKSFTKVNGHFQVALPWRSYPPYLPNNRELAVRRCELLKRRLLRDGELATKYKATMDEYIKKGHAERVPDEELAVKDKPLWYLPHHPVMHSLKPDKVRVVYDCAAKYKQASLNQELLQGPDEVNRLVGVLSRFRMESVGVVADIESMFHQVLVDPKDRDVLRFLWWQDGDLSKELIEYRMVKHVFGAKSSPSVADFCLKKTAELESNGIQQEAVDAVKRNMYVDDLMKSSATVEDAIQLVEQLRTLLSRGGFNLTKWCSNKREVLLTIPEGERTKSVANLEIERLPIESTLGLKWSAEHDKFVWEISEVKMNAINEKAITRRSILSVVYSVFDPLGFIAPYTMKAKLLLQLLCRKHLMIELGD